MKKILYIFTNNFPYGSGETFIESEIKSAVNYYEEIVIFVRDPLSETTAMRKLPFNVSVVSPKRKSKPQKILSYLYSMLTGILNGDLIREWKSHHHRGEMKKSLFFYCEAMDKYRQFKRCINADADITYYSYWFAECAYTAMKMKRREKRAEDIGFVSRAHRYDLYREITPLGYFPFRNMMMSEVDMVFPCSKGGVLELAEQGPQYAAKFEHSYLGTQSVANTGIDKQKEVFTVVTCSYISPVKRVKRLAEALALLEENAPKQIQWICFGDGNLKKELEEYCRKNLQGIKVDFKGQCKNDDVIEFYKNNYVDLFVNLSVSEGVPVSIMEAASFGIPAIATNVGGTSEIVRNNLTGILLEKDFTNDELKNSILSIINMGCGEVDALRKTTRDYWERNFNADDNYRRFYEKLLDMLRNK